MSVGQFDPNAALIQCYGCDQYSRCDQSRMFWKADRVPKAGEPQAYAPHQRMGSDGQWYDDGALCTLFCSESQVQPGSVVPGTCAWWAPNPPKHTEVQTGKQWPGPVDTGESGTRIPEDTGEPGGGEPEEETTQPVERGPAPTDGTVPPQTGETTGSKSSNTLLVVGTIAAVGLLAYAFTRR